MADVTGLLRLCMCFFEEKKEVTDNIMSYSDLRFFDRFNRFG